VAQTGWDFGTLVTVVFGQCGYLNWLGWFGQSGSMFGSADAAPPIATDVLCRPIDEIRLSF
jgi:hypothetical protein